MLLIQVNTSEDTIQNRHATEKDFECSVSLIAAIDNVYNLGAQRVTSTHTITQSLICFSCSAIVTGQ